MTNFTKPHGPHGAKIQTADRRPWQAPRLIDLDDLDTRCANGMVIPAGVPKATASAESTSLTSCSFSGANNAVLPNAIS